MLALLGVPSLMERNGEDRAYSPENWQLGDLRAHHHFFLWDFSGNQHLT